MIIQPNEEGWSFSGELQENQFCFVYKDNTRIFYGKSSTSTTDTLFVGTKEECEAEMLRLNIPVLYRLVSNNFNIIFFGPKIDSEVYEGKEFLGTKEECEEEILKLNTEAINDIPYKLIYNDNLTILFFGPEAESIEIEGTVFLGSKQECETEITRLDLSYEEREKDTTDNLMYDENGIVILESTTDNEFHDGI